MSLLSATTGSDGVTLTLSGSGFGTSGSSANIDQFGGKTFQIGFRHIDQPNVNWGGFKGSTVIPDAGGGFNMVTRIPRGEVPGGQNDIVIQLPYGQLDTSHPNVPPATLRINVTGSTSIRTTTGPVVNTYQYQDFSYLPAALVPVMGGGTPEFGPASGSIAG